MESMILFIEYDLAIGYFVFNIEKPFALN